MSTTVLPVYRCTRRRPYGPGSLGHTDVHARQGHYITARNADEALAEMVRRFPLDCGAFDVELWREA